MNPITILIDVATILVCALAVSGCGKAEDALAVPAPAPVETSGLPNTSAPSIVAVATATPTPVPTVTLTVYSLTKPLVTASSGADNGVTLYGIGSCAVYNSVTYCWDDGLKTFPHPTSAGGWTYWALTIDAVHYGGNGLAECPNFYANCITDRLVSPTTMNANVQSVLNQVPGASASHRTPAQVFSQGSSQQVSCADDGSGVLDCGAFTIDTNQAGL